MKYVVIILIFNIDLPILLVSTKNHKTVCKADGNANSKATKQDYANRTSKYYDKSASELKKYIQDYCNKTYTMNGTPTIHKWLMNNKGYLGAKYSCKN